jgi:hypothetical protein
MVFSQVFCLLEMTVKVNSSGTYYLLDLELIKLLDPLKIVNVHILQVSHHPLGTIPAYLEGSPNEENFPDPIIYPMPGPTPFKGKLVSKLFSVVPAWFTRETQAKIPC